MCISGMFIGTVSLLPPQMQPLRHFRYVLRPLEKHRGKERMASECTRMRQMMLWVIPICTRKNACSLKEVQVGIISRSKQRVYHTKQWVKSKAAKTSICYVLSHKEASVYVLHHHLFRLCIWPSTSVMLEQRMLLRLKDQEVHFSL